MNGIVLVCMEIPDSHRVTNEIPKSYHDSYTDLPHDLVLSQYVLFKYAQSTFSIPSKHNVKITKRSTLPRVHEYGHGE